MNIQGNTIWINGRTIAVDEAAVPVLSGTVQFGLNVFEGIRCYWNTRAERLYAFRLRDHMLRLLESMQLMEFEGKYTAEFLEGAFLKAVGVNKFREDVAVRQTIFLESTSGWSATGPTGMFIAPIRKQRGYDLSRGGVNCCVSSWERIDDRSMAPRIKTGANYVNSRMGQLEALRNGYDTCIFLNRAGKVAEAPGSCVFVVRKDTLITPPVTASILESITRDTVLTLAGVLGIPTIVRDIDRTELLLADEVFLCGTAAEITPVLSVDRRPKAGAQGSVTKRMATAYFQVARGESTSYPHWRTPVVDVT